MKIPKAKIIFKYKNYQHNKTENGYLYLKSRRKIKTKNRLVYEYEVEEIGIDGSGKLFNRLVTLSDRTLKRLMDSSMVETEVFIGDWQSIKASQILLGL